MRAAPLSFALTLMLSVASLAQSPSVDPPGTPPDQSGPEAAGHPYGSPVDRLTGGQALHGMSGKPTQKFEPDAARNLKKGEEALQDHRWDEAAKYFNYVRTHYPFQDAAKVAELKLGDVDFSRENYASARDRYTAFVRAHPANPHADYAAYRSALSYYKERPSSFFLLPPSYEKDLTDVQNGYNAMRTFVLDFPNSKYVPLAKKVIARCEHLLAEREMYVANFYAKRDHWAGAAGRLEGLVESYPNCDLAPDALWKLHKAYTKLKKPTEAKSALERLVTRFPKSADAKKARALLGS